MLDALLQPHPNQPKHGNPPSCGMIGAFPSQTWHKCNVQREHKCKENKTKINQTRGKRKFPSRSSNIILTKINSGRELQNSSWLSLSHFVALFWSIINLREKKSNSLTLLLKCFVTLLLEWRYRELTSTLDSVPCIPIAEKRKIFKFLISFSYRSDKFTMAFAIIKCDPLLVLK